MGNSKKNCSPIKLVISHFFGVKVLCEYMCFDIWAFLGF